MAVEEDVDGAEKDELEDGLEVADAVEDDLEDKIQGEGLNDVEMDAVD